MNEFEKIREKLEEKIKDSNKCPRFETAFRQVAFEEAIEIVNQVAEEHVADSVERIIQTCSSMRTV